MFPRLTAPSGYVFTGWYYDGSIYEPGDVYQIDADLAVDVIIGQTDSGEDIISKTVYIYPIFTKIEDLPVEVTTITLDANGGTIASVAADVAGDFTGATVGGTSITIEDQDLNEDFVLPSLGFVERPGYVLKGWSLTSGENNSVNFALGVTVGADNREVTGNTLYAVWEQQRITINYEVVGPEGATVIVGSLSTYVESNILQATGTVTGSTASETDEAYTFVGWYSDEECTILLTTDAHYTPSKNADGIYEAATYYAKFEYSLTYMNVSKTGMQDNESAVFTVTRVSTGDSFDIVVNNGVTVTIYGVYVGEQYTVTEKTDWTWRYASEGTKTVTVEVNPDASKTINLAAFTNTLENTKWLADEDSVDNLFGAYTGGLSQ